MKYQLLTSLVATLRNPKDVFYPCEPISPTAYIRHIDDGKLYVEQFEVELNDPFESYEVSNVVDLYLYFPENENQRTQYIEVEDQVGIAEFFYPIQLINQKKLKIFFYDEDTIYDRYIGLIEMNIDGSSIQRGSCMCMEKIIWEKWWYHSIGIFKPPKTGICEFKICRK